MQLALRLAVLTTILAGICFGAGLDGTWILRFGGELAEQKAEMTLTVTGQEVTGKLTSGGAVKGAFANGLVQLSFPFHAREMDVKAEMTITGRLDGDRIEGDFEFDAYTGSFTATRVE